MDRFYNFRSDAAGDVLEVFGEILSDNWFDEDAGGVSASNFRSALQNVKGDLTVLINSPGGDTFAGADIYTALREHAQGGGRVTCYVTGLAASAASVIAMAGDEIVISPVGTMMIHDPWTMAMGNAQEMRELADTLDIVRDALAAAYIQKTGLTRERINELLAAETWMDANTAVEMGFADRIGIRNVTQNAQARMAAAIRDRESLQQVRASAERILADVQRAAEPECEPETDVQACEIDGLRMRLMAMCI